MQRMLSLILLREMTSISLEKGIIPSTCPFCGQPITSLYIHHWGPYKQHEAIHSGMFRRMCQSCNMLLKDVYSMPWGDQVSRLGNREEDWSQLVSTEKQFIRFLHSRGWKQGAKVSKQSYSKVYTYFLEVANASM